MAVTKARAKAQQQTEPIKSNQNKGPAATTFTCKVSKGTEIQGAFNVDQNARMDGKIKGDVKCLKHLVMGESGKVEGRVEAESAMIEGKIEGEVRILGLLHLRPTAVINGNIYAKKIMIDEGATYNGQWFVGTAPH